MFAIINENMRTQFLVRFFSNLISNSNNSIVNKVLSNQTSIHLKMIPNSENNPSVCSVMSRTISQNNQGRTSEHFGRQWKAKRFLPCADVTEGRLQLN
ncbi:hypothetical protein CEXT_674961 [Caerostris extrusa]|uniref:Uncharacterized protein n=1 Tax=Caerostris extrusa TaxID=172846 RepID=A0AAV4S1B2_CAEEX|nr:hypothetical protein CEXT_674961 [Caerostris extrusa]